MPNHQSSDGRPYKTAKLVAMGGINTDMYSIITLPGILQEAYDSLDISNKPEVKFFVAMKAKYRDQNNQPQIFEIGLDSSYIYNEDVKSKLHKFSARIDSFAYVIVAATPKNTLELPTHLLQNRIREIHSSMFNTQNYESGDFFINENTYYQGMKALNTMDTTALKLLEPIVRVYGGSLWVDFESNDWFITQQAFQAMKEGENAIGNNQSRK